MALHSSYSPRLDSYTSYSSDSSAPRTPSPNTNEAPYNPVVFSGDHDSHPHHLMHSEYQQPWSSNGHGHDASYYPHESREQHYEKRPAEGGYSNGSKGTPELPSPDMRRDAGPPGEPRDLHHSSSPRPDYSQAGRRATFPYVRQDRERDESPLGPGYPSNYLPPPPHLLHQHQQQGGPSPGPGAPPAGMYAEHDYPHHPPPPPPGSGPYHHEYDQGSYYRPPPHHYGHPMHSMPHPMHGHPLGMTYISPHTGLPVQHTDDAASKETQYLRRRCFNCHTTEPPSWRRSTLNPGKIVCNKCGLYERTHLRPRPLRFDELRAGNKARKSATNGAGKAPKKAAGGAHPSPANASPQSVSAPVPTSTGVHPDDLSQGKPGEPRDYNLVRRSSVGSSGSSSNGNSSDWDSAYSSSNGSAPTSGPSTTFSSPASGSYPLPRESTHSPALGGDGIRLPSAPLSDIGSHHSSPLVAHQSPQLMHPSIPPMSSASPQLLHNMPGGRSPPRKSHTYPSNGNHYQRPMDGPLHGEVQRTLSGSPAPSL